MRARWTLLALALCGCPEKPKEGPKPPPPEPIIKGAPVGVQLPKTWDGYVAVRDDDRAVAWFAGGEIVTADVQGGHWTMPATPDQERTVRSALVREQYMRLSDHPPDRYVEVPPQLAFANGEVTAKFGADTLRGKPLTSIGAGAVPSVAGWSPDASVLIVKLVEGAQLTFAILPVTK